MQGKWIKIAAATIAVPVVTVSALHLVRAYEAGTTFQPFGSERDLQVNQVVFSGDEDTASQKDNTDQNGERESELWEKDKTAEDSLGPNLRNNANYLFQTGKANLPDGAESINLAGEEASANNAILPGENTNQTGNGNYVYDVTGDADNADLVISGNGQGAGSGMGTGTENGTGTGSSNGKGQGENTPATTPGPSEPSRTPMPTPKPTVRPADTVKDPEPEKTGPNRDNFYTDGPFSENGFSWKDEETKVVIEAASQSDNLYGYLYMGQKVDRNSIYCALNTYVIVNDSYRYIWQKDQLRSYKDGKAEDDGYVDIQSVSFDGGKTWNAQFPVTIPIDTAGVDMQIKVAYRYSTKEKWSDPVIVEYSPAVSRVYVLNRKLTEETEAIDSSMIVNAIDLNPDINKKYNLYQQQSVFFNSNSDLLRYGAVNTDSTEEYSGEFMPQEQEQQCLFPGWTENGEPVEWFYEVTPGRHILEPMDMIPLPDEYHVELQLFSFSEDYQEDPDAEYGYLQTLKSYSGDSADLVIPEGTQAIHMDNGMVTVDSVTIPNTVVLCKMDTDTLEVRKVCNVSEENPVYKAVSGILMDKKETQILEIPSQIHELVIPDTITDIHMSVNNQLRKLEIQAETKEQLPVIALQKLKNCSLVMKSDLVDRFLVDYREQFTEEGNNGVVPKETPTIRYTVQNDTIINNQGSLRKVLKEGGDTIYLADGVTKIEADAFVEEKGNQIPATVLNMPKTGKEVTLEKNCFANSKIQSIRCYTPEQATSIARQLQLIGREDIKVQTMLQAAPGYWYAQEANGSKTLVNVPENITSFDGVKDVQGNAVAITAIGDNAFSKCKNLSWVVLPESVKKIGYEAFRGCNSLQGILIDARDEIYIGDRSMEDCPSLRFAASNAMTATRENDYIPVITDENDLQATKKYLFYVLNGSTGYNGYATEFSKDDEIDSYVMEDLDETGEYKMLYGATGGNSWLALRSGSKMPEKVMLPETTENIYIWAMAGTTAADGAYTVNWEKLKNLKVFNECAFYNSELSGAVTLENAESTCYIGRAAFGECKGITEVSVNGVVGSLGKEVFQGDTNLQKVTLGKMLDQTALYSSVFQGCASLRDVYLQENPPQLAFDMYTYSHIPYRFNIEDWNYEEEAELLRIHIPQSAGKEYIKKWRYAIAGYVTTLEAPAYQNMWETIQFENMDWFTWKFPEDEVVDALAKEELLNAENHLRKILGMTEAAEPIDYYPYHINDDGFITLIGAPSDVTEVRLDAGTLEMLENWGLDYVGTDAFQNSKNLKQVTFPDGFLGIYSNAFRGVKSDSLTLVFEGNTPPLLMTKNEEEQFSFGIEGSKITVIVPEGAEAAYYDAWNNYGVTIAGYVMPATLSVSGGDVKVSVSDGDAKPQSEQNEVDKNGTDDIDLPDTADDIINADSTKEEDRSNTEEDASDTSAAQEETIQ